MKTVFCTEAANQEKNDKLGDNDLKLINTALGCFGSNEGKDEKEKEGS